MAHGIMIFGSWEATEDHDDLLMVALDTSENLKVKLADTGDEVIGIAGHLAKTGEALNVIHEGAVQVRLGATIAVGDRLGPGTGADEGKAIIAGSGVMSLGVALEAGVTGDIVFMLIEKLIAP